MPRTQNGDLEKIALALPRKTIREIEFRVEQGAYTSTAEWIRQAIREMLAKDAGMVGRLMAEEPKFLESIRQARAGEIEETSINEILKRVGASKPDTTPG